AATRQDCRRRRRNQPPPARYLWQGGARGAIQVCDRSARRTVVRRPAVRRAMRIPIQGFTPRIPAFAAIGAAIVGLVNIGSALTPNIRWRGHLLLEVEPVEAIRLFHALAFPTGIALLVVAPYLAKRRRRAWQAAIVLMLAL